MSWFGEPTLSYSHDGGATWRTDGPMIGPNVLIRVVLADGKVIFQGHAVAREVECESCHGTGKVTRHRYVEDERKNQ
jgi:hypothetical protein